MPPAPRVLRVVIFASSSPAAIEHVEALADAFPDWELLVVEQAAQGAAAGGSRTSGAVTTAGISLPVHLRVLSRLIGGARRPSARRDHVRVGLAPSLRELRRPNLRYRAFERLDSEETMSFVSTADAWIAVGIDVPELPPVLAAVPRHGTVVLEKCARLSALPPAPAANEAEPAGEAGVTVRWVTEGVETDSSLYQIRFKIPAYSTPAGLAAQLDLLGSNALVAALRCAADRGAPEKIPTVADPFGEIPATSGINQHHAGIARRVHTRQAGLLGWLRGAAKNLVFLALLTTWVPVRNFLRGRRGRCHTRVLLFHRVSDSYRDSITVGIEQFATLLKLIKYGYEVITMSEFLASRGVERRRPAVVLTFDDGYQDNYLAALLLRREGLPCTFFISTRIVGDRERGFPHDLTALGHFVPALSWHEVRQMARWGFDIGNHSADHPNLAELTPDEALANVSLASADLERELGEANPGNHWLAYPYGDDGAMTAHVRNRLHEIGITHCFSASGGTNGVDFAPLNVLRQNIDCNFGGIRFLMALEGWIARTGYPRTARKPQATQDGRAVETHRQAQPVSGEAARFRGAPDPPSPFESEAAPR